MKKINTVVVPVSAKVVLECGRIAAEFQKIDGREWTDNDVFETAVNVGMNALSQRAKHEREMIAARKRAPVANISGGVRHVY